MENDLINQSYWHLITIEDSDDLPGKSIFDVMQVIFKVYKFEYVILNDINRAGKARLIRSMNENEGLILKSKEAVKSLLDITQFDWADFFLFFD